MRGEWCRSRVGIAFFGGPYGPTARRSPHGRSRHEYPSDVGNRLAPVKPALFEQPWMRAVKLLEGVVRQHDRVGPAGDFEDERVASPDRTGGRRDHAAARDGFFVPALLFGADAVAERRIDDHRDDVERMLLDKRVERILELRHARQVAALRCDVRTVDDEM